MLHQRDEAEKFIFAIATLQPFLYTDEDDYVWEKITMDARKSLEKSMEFPQQHQHSCPFVKSERPDILYECDDFVMGIECFEFDSSLTSRKGSKQKLKEIQADKHILETYKSKNQERTEAVKVSELVDVVFSIENYIKSLLNVFHKHAKNIDVYRGNIREKYPEKKIYLSFYIEDTTALGNYIISSRGKETMLPLCVKEFIDVLSETCGIDYIITNTQGTYVHSIHIQKINERFLETLYGECYDFSHDVYRPYRYTMEAHFCNAESPEEK